MRGRDDDAVPSRSTLAARRSLTLPHPPSLLTQQTTPKQTASCLIFGATGAVGKEVLNLIASDPAQFGMGWQSLRIVAAAPDAKKELAALHGSEAAAGNGGGDNGKAKAAPAGEGAAASPPKKSATADVVLFDCDACDAAHVKAAIDAAQADGHQIVAIANCIGGYLHKPLVEMSADEVVAFVSRDLLPATCVLKCCAHALAGGQDASGAGHQHRFRASIVCVSASLTSHGMKHTEAMAAAKGAVEALHLAAAATLAQCGVKVNCVAPGLISHTPASAGDSAQEPAATKSAAIYPPHRLVTAEEVARTVATVMSPTLLPFTTGSVIHCDGGLSRLQTYANPTVHV